MLAYHNARRAACGVPRAACGVLDAHRPVTRALRCGERSPQAFSDTPPPAAALAFRRDFDDRLQPLA